MQSWRKGKCDEQSRDMTVRGGEVLGPRRGTRGMSLFPDGEVWQRGGEGEGGQ